MLSDPKTVQTLLRHSDVTLTLQFYTQAVSRDRMVSAKILTAILGHAPDKNGLRADWVGMQIKIRPSKSQTFASVFYEAFHARTDSGLKPCRAIQTSSLEWRWPGRSWTADESLFSATWCNVL